MFLSYREIEARAQRNKRAVSDSWEWMKPTLKRRLWMYDYRAVDKNADIVDFYLSEHRDENAARTFLKRVIGCNGLPSKVVIDKNGFNVLALHNINVLLWLSGVLMLNLIDIVDIKYINNIVEQSHRPIKQKMVQALGWKLEAGALATMAA